MGSALHRDRHLSKGKGFGVQGWGAEAWVKVWDQLGFRVWGPWIIFGGICVSAMGIGIWFEVWDLGDWFKGVGCLVSDVSGFGFRVSGFGFRVSNFWSFRFWVSDFRSQGIRFLVPCDSGFQFQVSGAVYFSCRLFLASDFGLRELAYRDVEKVSSKFWRKQLRVAVRVIPVFPGSGFRVQVSGFKVQGLK